MPPSMAARRLRRAKPAPAPLPCRQTGRAVASSPSAPTSDRCERRRALLFVAEHIAPPAPVARRGAGELLQAERHAAAGGVDPDHLDLDLLTNLEHVLRLVD